VGGQVLPIGNAEMIHLWIGPDYIDDAPIFAHDHPELLGGYNPQPAGPPSPAFRHKFPAAAPGRGATGTRPWCPSGLCLLHRELMLRRCSAA